MIMKKVIITGAGGKLGPYICDEFSRRGWQVLKHYASHKPEEGAVVRADLSAVSAEEFLRECFGLTGGADVLVNCFSVFSESSYHDTDWDSFSRDLFINSWQPFDLTRRFCSMTASGCVVNVLDSRITGPDDKHFNYHMSKLLLKELTIEAARNAGPGHRVNAVAPGLIGEGDGSQLPLKRPGLPADVAGAVCYLAAAEFTTGQIVFVDGGRHIRERNG